jgi:four helix bundle protein
MAHELRRCCITWPQFPRSDGLATREAAGCCTKGITDKFSPRGTFILGDQMLRAAVSVPGNIAEGRGRLSKADNVRHLCIARGSLNELLSHVILAVDYDFTSAANTRVAFDLGDEVGRMLNAQIRTLGTRRLR